MTSPPPQDPLTLPGPWNAIATAYDEEFSSQIPEFLDAALSSLSPGPTDVFLDVATGPGRLALALAPRVARVVAIDFAEAMIAQLRENIGRAGLGNVEPHVMDATALSLESSSFDGCVSMLGWFLLADRARGMAEMHRVLRPGGRLLVTSWMPPVENTVLGAGLAALREALPDLPRPAGPLPTQVPEVVAGEVRAAGFGQVEARIVRAPVSYASVEDYFRTMQRASAPFVVLKKKLGDRGWQEAMEKTMAALKQRFGDGAVSLEAAAIFTSARR
jgi:SAM-dependent methyltransferase